MVKSRSRHTGSRDSSSFGYQVLVIVLVACAALIGWSDYYSEDALYAPASFSRVEPTNFKCGQEKVFTALSYCPSTVMDKLLILIPAHSASCSKERRAEEQADCDTLLAESQEKIRSQGEDIAVCGKNECEKKLNSYVSSISCPSSSQDCPNVADPCSKTYAPNPVECPLGDVQSISEFSVSPNALLGDPYDPNAQCTYVCQVRFSDSSLGRPKGWVRPQGSVTVGCNDCLPH